MRKIISNILGGITAFLGIQRLFAAMYVANIPFLSQGADPLFGQALLLIFASAILFTIANVKKNPNRIPFFGKKGTNRIDVYGIHTTKNYNSVDYWAYENFAKRHEGWSTKVEPARREN